MATNWNYHVKGLELGLNVIKWLLYTLIKDDLGREDSDFKTEEVLGEEIYNLFKPPEEQGTITVIQKISELKDEFLYPLLNSIKKSIDEVKKGRDDLFRFELGTVKLDGLKHISELLSKSFSESFQSLIDVINGLMGQLEEIINQHKGRICMVDALKIIYNHQYRLEGLNLKFRLDTTKIIEGVSIYHPFFECEEVQNLELLAKVLEYLRTCNVELLASKLDKDLRTHEKFNRTCKVLAGYLEDKELIKFAKDRLLPILVSPFNKEKIAFEDWSKILNMMICNRVMLEVEVFKRIANLGLPSIPRVKVIEDVGEKSKEIGEVDILLPYQPNFDEDVGFTAVEITTSRNPDDLRQKVSFHKKLRELKLVSNSVLICYKELPQPESSEHLRYVSFKELDEKSWVELLSLFS